MSAVVAPREISLVLRSRELRRELRIERNKYGHMWLGVYPDGRSKRTGRASAFAGGVPADYHIFEYETLNNLVNLSIVAGVAHFPITRDEADRLVAELGFEVRKS